MSRAAHTALITLSIAGLLLVAGLVMAAPPATRPTVGALAQDAVGDPLAGGAQPAAGASPPVAHGLAMASDAGLVLARGMTVVAVAATDAAIAAAVGDRDSGASAADRVAVHPRARPDHARRAIALPYFSFARGVRRDQGA